MENHQIEAHLCEVKDCDQPGVELWLPQWGISDAEEKPVYYCDFHMHNQGWCPGCLCFYGGIESFDYSRTGFCENCSIEVEQDEYGLDPDYYENY